MSIRNYTSNQRARPLGDVRNTCRLYFQVFPLKMCTTSQSQYQSIGAQGLEGREIPRQCGPQLFFWDISTWGWMEYDYVFMQWKQLRSKLSLEGRWKLMNYSGFDIRQWWWNASFTWRGYNNVNMEIHSQSTWRTIMEMRYYYMRFSWVFPLKKRQVERNIIHIGWGGSESFFKSS